MKEAGQKWAIPFKVNDEMFSKRVELCMGFFCSTVTDRKKDKVWILNHPDIAAVPSILNENKTRRGGRSMLRINSRAIFIIPLCMV